MQHSLCLGFSEISIDLCNVSCDKKVFCVFRVTRRDVATFDVNSLILQNYKAVRYVVFRIIVKNKLHLYGTRRMSAGVPLYGTRRMSASVPLYGTRRMSAGVPLYDTRRMSAPVYGTRRMSAPSINNV